MSSLNQKKTLLFLTFLFLILAVFWVLGKKAGFISNYPKKPNSQSVLTPAPLVTPTPSPTPTTRPLTFAEMNALYGPCAYLPTLMYHHIQSAEVAKKNNQIGLTVTPETFAKQMQYLKDKGYNSISFQDLVNFLENGTPIAKKSVLIAFDDAYSDFATDAYPILVGVGFRAAVFVPTGLVNNPGYLTWDQIRQIASEGRVAFANHTWSHKNVAAVESVMEKEISMADTKLSERGLNTPKVFAYPYGLDSARAERYLTQLGYMLAFSTRPGSILCLKQRFNLPRVRIGEASLSAYGF